MESLGDSQSIKDWLKIKNLTTNKLMNIYGKKCSSKD